jgi:hypothetical protein
MPRTFTSGKPTRSSHMRVGSDSTGVLQSEGIENRQIGRAPATRQGPLHPAQIRSATKGRGIKPGAVLRRPRPTRSLSQVLGGCSRRLRFAWAVPTAPSAPSGCLHRQPRRSA